MDNAPYNYGFSDWTYDSQNITCNEDTPYLVICHHCGSDFLHIYGVAVGTASGRGALIEAEGEDEHSKVTLGPIELGSSGRRQQITLLGYCEQCGRPLRYLLLQHKGKTFFKAISIKSAVEEVVEERRKLCESPPELALYDALCEEMYPPHIYPQHKVGRYRLDFALPHLKIGIEVDGLTYHNGQESFIRDQQRQRDLQAQGWTVIRFAAKETLNNPSRCLNEIARLVDAQLAG